MIDPIKPEEIVLDWEPVIPDIVFRAMNHLLVRNMLPSGHCRIGVKELEEAVFRMRETVPNEDGYFDFRYMQLYRIATVYREAGWDIAVYGIIDFQYFYVQTDSSKFGRKHSKQI